MPTAVLITGKGVLIHSHSRSLSISLSHSLCPLVSPSGYPPLLVRKIVHEFHCRFPSVPIFGFVDCDAHGLDIFLSYQQGTINMPESYLYAIPQLLYLGVEWDDTDKTPLDPNQKDIHKLKALGPFLARKKRDVFGNAQRQNTVQFAVHLRLQRQLRIQQQRLKKKEIESLHNLGTYLPRKIKNMLDWYGRFEPRLTEFIHFVDGDRVPRPRSVRLVEPQSFSSIQRAYGQGRSRWNRQCHRRDLEHQLFRGYSQPQLAMEVDENKEQSGVQQSGTSAVSGGGVGDQRHLQTYSQPKIQAPPRNMSGSNTVNVSKLSPPFSHDPVQRLPPYPM